MTTTRILLVDDQSIILDGLTALLVDVENLKVVGKVGSGEAAIAAVAELQPDVVVMDISMPPGMDGIEATQQIKKRWPHVRVLILSMYHLPEFVKEVMDAGASGYLLKNTNKKQLCQALRAVAAGHKFLAEEVQEVLNEAPLPENGQDHGPLLTRREKEIIKLVASGRTTQEISETLSLSYSTVETHRKNVMHKLALKNPAGLVRYALERGWNA